MASPFRQEIGALARRFGTPAGDRVVLPREHRYIEAAENARKAEILMVLRRRGGRLLVMTKPFYPERVLRLPTGGVEPGETILQALEREVVEETSLKVEVVRFLAHIEYRIDGLARPEDAPHFETFAFLLKDLGGVLRSSDPNEQMEFAEVEASELLQLAVALESVARIDSDEVGDSWDSWGKFRAIGMRAVHRTLENLQ